MAVQLGNERTMVYQDGLDLVFERIFEAPRELVWTVMTDPARVPKWWGPHGYTTTVEEMDVRPGGRWRFVTTTTGGEVVPFYGAYLEVEPLERIVRTFGVDIPGWGEPGRETMTLEDLGDGRTRLSERGHFRSAEELEAQLAVGMVAGALEQYDRLADEIALG
jgi:uncharacterized protein YndB with AHSA1/START domain